MPSPDSVLFQTENEVKADTESDDDDIKRKCKVRTWSRKKGVCTSAGVSGGHRCGGVMCHGGGMVRCLGRATGHMVVVEPVETGMSRHETK